MKCGRVPVIVSGGIAMVEPVSLTLGAIAAGVVAAMIEKSTEKAAEGVVDAGASVGAKVIAWLKGKLSSKKELELVTEAPDSKRAVEKLADVIDAEIVNELDVSELRALLDDVKERDPGLHQSAIGHHIVQASNSTVMLNSPDWNK